LWELGRGIGNDEVEIFGAVLLACAERYRILGIAPPTKFITESRHLSVCTKVSNPWHRICRAPPNLLLNSDILDILATTVYHQALKACFVKEINQTGKYEAVQKFHSANILVGPRPPKPSCCRHAEARTYL